MSQWIKSAQVVSWLGLGVATLFMGYTEIKRPRLPDGVRGYVDIVYKRDGWRQQKLDVYVPEKVATATRPAIVAIHGGSWKGGTKNSFGREVALLVPYGYVVFSVDYTLAKPGQPSWPDNLDDVKDAVRWVRRHADEFGVDPNRVASYGSSAGGHLAALLGTHACGTDPETEVQAVVDLYGPSDLIDLVNNPRARDALLLVFGKSAQENRSVYEAASPILQVSSDDAPMLLIHGAEDDSVPVAHTQRMGDQLAAAGVESEQIILQGEGHSFRLDAKRLNLVPRIAAFLDRAMTPMSKGK